MELNRITAPKQEAYKNSSIVFLSLMILVNILALATQRDEAYIRVMTYIVCILYSMTLFVSVQKTGFCSLQTLFLIALLVFNLGRLFASLIGTFDFRNAQYGVMDSFVWSSDTTILVLNSYFIFISIFLLSFFINNRKQINNNQTKPHLFPNEKKALELFKTIFIIVAPIYALCLISEVLAVRAAGFTSIYTNNDVSFAGSSMIGVLRLAFTVSYYMICVTTHSRRTFTRFSIAYLCVTGILLFAGYRANFIVSILAFLYMRKKLFHKDLKFGSVVLFAIAMLMMIYVVSIARDNSSTNYSFAGAMNYFFVSMSNSLNVPAYYLENRAVLSNNSYPYVLDPIVRLYMIVKYPFVGGGQGLEVIKVQASLSHQITYNMSPEYYLSGAGLGSNFIAEMLEFGLIGVFFGSLLVVWFIKYFDNNMSNNMFLKFMSIQIIGKLLFEPRAELFYDTYNLLKYIAIFSLIYAIFKFTLNKKVGELNGRAV